MLEREIYVPDAAALAAYMMKIYFFNELHTTKDDKHDSKLEYIYLVSILDDGMLEHRNGKLTSYFTSALPSHHTQAHDLNASENTRSQGSHQSMKMVRSSIILVLMTFFLLT